jgi:transcriptional regulator with XRE-family HTH domain
MGLPVTPTEASRLSSGFRLEVAAKRVRVSPAYLRSVETGRRYAPYILACRLSRLYGCPLDVFLVAQTTPDTGSVAKLQTQPIKR